MSAQNSLFVAVVADARLHPNFVELRDSEFHVATRALLDSLFQEMGDPNGNFARDFQADGFHSRVFELGCYAYLRAAGLLVDRRFDRPDFIVTRGGASVAVEATTANPSGAQRADISLRGLQSLSEEDLFAKVCNDFPIRMANVLRKKLRHRYWELPHCAGMPFVLMVSPLFEPASVYYTDDALAGYLYGLADEHRYGDRGVRSGFFMQADVHHVSAVLYCNQFTVPRFFRLGGDLDVSHLSATRQGYCYLTESDQTLEIAEYRYQVGDPAVPEETWWQGVTVFHNPNARIPLSPGLLPSTSVISVEDNCLVREVDGFHPVTSFLHTVVSTPHGNRATAT